VASFLRGKLTRGIASFNASHFAKACQTAPRTAEDLPPLESKPNLYAELAFDSVPSEGRIPFFPGFSSSVDLSVSADAQKHLWMVRQRTDNIRANQSKPSFDKS
jgi:hypothetical protein